MISSRRHVVALALACLAAATTADAQSLAGCPMFPPDNAWNTPIDNLPTSPSSSAYVATIGATTSGHPDFDAIGDGIPYAIVPGTQAKATVTFDYPDESDPGPYPIPPNPPIESGSDHHLLIVDRDNCTLYELYGLVQNADGTWHAGSCAIWNLRSDALRPANWTSADAAGLPILPGLVRYDEAAAGTIAHAIRFTAALTQSAYVWPARHFASSSTDPTRPPMGQRFRLRANFDLTSISPLGQVIFRAMQHYGVILADNGSNWYFSGVPDTRWPDSALHNDFLRLHGSDFEAVDVSSMIVSPDSGQARQTGSADIPLWPGWALLLAIVSCTAVATSRLHKPIG